MESQDKKVVPDISFVTAAINSSSLNRLFFLSLQVNETTKEHFMLLRSWKVQGLLS